LTNSDNANSVRSGRHFTQVTKDDTTPTTVPTLERAPGYTRVMTPGPRVVVAGERLLARVRALVHLQRAPIGKDAATALKITSLRVGATNRAFAAALIVITRLFGL